MLISLRRRAAPRSATDARPAKYSQVLKSFRRFVKAHHPLAWRNLYHRAPGMSFSTRFHADADL